MRPQIQRPDADPVDHIIAWHDGDSRAAIETLMEDILHLRMQLALATAAMAMPWSAPHFTGQVG